MPFKNWSGPQGSFPSGNAQKIFIGRTNELNFFTEYILKPEDPAYNILSIYGDGGVGKSTLIHRYRELALFPDFKEYCLTALVDERQATAASMMEKFADQLNLNHRFKHALAHYKDLLRKQQDEQETVQDAVLQRAPDFAGAAVEGVPLVGPLLRESMKVTTAHVLDRYRNERQLPVHLEDPVGKLTQAFVGELNRLAESLVTLSDGRRSKRRRRIVLIFDTFEQLAAEAAPWLLDYFLEAEISNSIVLLTAGRIPIERSLPDDPKRWLPYRDSNTIYTLPLNSFTREETEAYLQQRHIDDPERINRIWQLSRGLPLYLSLLTSDMRSDVDPMADVVANFLRWIPVQQALKRRLVLNAALFSLPFNQDDLAAFDYISLQERSSLYQWLIQQPFVRVDAQDGHYRYHELAEDLFSRHLYQRSPNDYYAARRALAAHYQARLDNLRKRGHHDYYRAQEWQSLTLALAQQLLFLPDMLSHSQAIELLLQEYDLIHQEEEITRVLRAVAQVQLYNQASPDARLAASLLLNYLEAEPVSQEHIAAATALLQRVQHTPNFSPALLARIHENRGIAYRNHNDYQQALADFDRLIQLNPQSAARAYGNRGITYRAMRNYERALQDFNAAITLDDHLDWVYVGRGDVHRHRGNYELALQDLGRAIALDPDYAQAYGSRGRVYHLLGEYERSISDFERAIALDPERAWFYAQQGENYRDTRQYERAIELYSQAIALEPELFPWAYGSRGYTYFRLRDYQRALADLTRALELDPTYVWGYGQRGRVYRHLDMYEQALADFNRAIQLDPHDAWAYSHRGLVYSSLREYTKALDDFNRAIELNPGHANFYGRRGSIHLNLGDFAAAQADYEHNYSLTPQDIRACWMSAWITTCQRKLDTEMARTLELVAAQDTQSYFSYLCRGLACWLQGQQERALAELQTAQSMRDSMWDAPFWLAIIHGHAGHMQAIQFLQQALEYGIPSTLLAPLSWLTETQASFYAQHIQPLLPSDRHLHTNVSDAEIHSKKA